MSRFLPEIKKLTPEACAKRAARIFSALWDEGLDSRDIGSILSMSLCTLLVNARTQGQFEKYKKAVIESIGDCRFTDSCENSEGKPS